MPFEITVPQLSDTMTEGTVVKWVKNEGDKVKSGEILVEIETDKAVMEAEAYESGTLAVVLIKEGEKAPVGGVIAVLAVGSEKVEDVKKKYAAGVPASGAPAAKAPVKAEAAKADSGAKTDAPAAVAAPPRTIEEGDPAIEAQNKEVREMHVSQHPSIEATTPPASGGNGHEAGRHKASPLARRIAAEQGIDLADIDGTGPGGRIVQADVIAVSAKGSNAKAPAGVPASLGTSSGPSKAAPAPLPQRVAKGAKEVVSLNKMRQTIALRLQQSKQQIPHFYESIDVDMEAISSLRERLNKGFEKQGIRLSVSDFINKAIASALVQHPNVNSHFNAQKNEYTRFGDVNLGIAVALPDGLIVPVLRNIDQMGLKEIRQRSQDLAERARAGRLKGEEMTGATFTVSTLGQWGITHFNAIINPPEVGILAIGVAEKRAVVRGGQVVARSTMTVTVSVDHRVVDGAAAAEFLKTLKALLEEPGLMLA